MSNNLHYDPDVILTKYMERAPQPAVVVVWKKDDFKTVARVYFAFQPVVAYDLGRRSMIVEIFDYAVDRHDPHYCTEVLVIAKNAWPEDEAAFREGHGGLPIYRAKGHSPFEVTTVGFTFRFTFVSGPEYKPDGSFETFKLFVEIEPK